MLQVIIVKKFAQWILILTIVSFIDIAWTWNLS